MLNGVFAKPGIELLGSVLAYLVQTDSADFSHVPILLPFCRPTLFDFIGFVPFSEKLKINPKEDELEELTTTALTENNRKAVKNLLSNHYDSLLKQLNKVRIQMNKVHKSIKRQERTRGLFVSMWILIFNAHNGADVDISMVFEIRFNINTNITFNVNVNITTVINICINNNITLNTSVNINMC